jgi:hypothetical protein
MRLPRDHQIGTRHSLFRPVAVLTQRFQNDRTKLKNGPESLLGAHHVR